MLNVHTVAHGKHVKGGQDFDVVKKLVCEMYGVLHCRVHLAKLELGEVHDDGVQEKYEMLAHTKSGRRRNGEDVIGGEHVEVVVAAVAEAVNNIHCEMRTQWVNKGSVDFDQRYLTGSVPPARPTDSLQVASQLPLLGWYVVIDKYLSCHLTVICAYFHSPSS